MINRLIDEINVFLYSKTSSSPYLSTHSDHEGNGADHLQNEGDT